MQLNEWMKEVDGDVNVAKLSLPGTHNSAACHTALPSVQCQGESVTEQLEHGVRFLDIRCSKNFLKSDDEEAKELVVIHGKFPVRIIKQVKVKEILQEVYEFLENNRSETVLVSLKQEGTGVWDNDHDEFPNCIWDHYIGSNQDKWYLDTQIPRLDDCRGKAILFRRFGVNDEHKKSNFGIDAAWWSYNTTDDDRGTVCVQDWCEIEKEEDISKKAQYVKEHVQRAIQYNESNSDAKLFINFCSGSNFFDHDCWPAAVAEGLERDNINDAFGKGCGIVVLDYAEKDDWKSVKALVNKNR